MLLRKVMHKFSFFLFLFFSLMAKAELLKPNTNGNLQVINALINAGSDPEVSPQIMTKIQ